MLQKAKVWYKIRQTSVSLFTGQFRPSRYRQMSENTAFAVLQTFFPSSSAAWRAERPYRVDSKTVTSRDCLVQVCSILFFRAHSAPLSFRHSRAGGRQLHPGIQPGEGSATGNGGPGGTRTPDLLVRSQALYPTELQARGLIVACISHHLTAEARGKAVFRVSCLVIRENHGRGPGSLQKKWLTAGELEKPGFVIRGKTLMAVLLERDLAARPAGPLTHFAPPCGETGRLDGLPSPRLYLEKVRGA